MEKSEKEKRIRALTKLYYSNPKVQESLLKFSKDREVVPRYFEGFGKRPDTIQYNSDIMGLVNKGATSFHASEEIWKDPLQLSSEITKEEMNALRKNWDLLIDIDSPYLDISREAAKLVVETLERYGIMNYGIKFSGSKGFHIIVSGEAFPEEYDGKERSLMFPEWPRAITEFLFKEIKAEFRIRVGRIMSFSHLEKDDVVRTYCKRCGNIASKGSLVRMKCPVCNLDIERRDVKSTKRRLRCLNNTCAGVLEIIDNVDYFFCENCKDPDNEKMSLASNRYPESFGTMRGELADERAELDLVLVAPRHLFRMPYSLHEKTSLASAVLTKEQLDSFSPRDADPLKIEIKEFLKKANAREGEKLLISALEWKKRQVIEEEKNIKKKYENYGEFKESDFSGVDESMFPEPIKKLLLGLKEGKKRGLFILITFLRALGFSPDYINNKVREWNKKNEPQLKEGYVKGQIDWHLKQKRKILPPNYDNESFYKDIGLITKKPDVKNPIVEVSRALRRKRAGN